MFSIKILYIKQAIPPLIKHPPFLLKRFSIFLKGDIEVPEIKTNDIPPSRHFQAPLSPPLKNGGGGGVQTMNNYCVAQKFIENNVN